jgi:hypothetical protein
MGSGLYIVDYDIPEEPARERIQFYRDMKVLQNRYSKDYSEFSTQSVFCTYSKILACAVFLLVTAHVVNHETLQTPWGGAVFLLVTAHGGHGHVYYGTEITDQIEMVDMI